MIFFKVKVWNIPPILDESSLSSLNASATLSCFNHKINRALWHNHSENILTVASKDEVKLFDIASTTNSVKGKRIDIPLYGSCL